MNFARLFAQEPSAHGSMPVNANCSQTRKTPKAAVSASAIKRAAAPVATNVNTVIKNLLLPTIPQTQLRLEWEVPLDDAKAIKWWGSPAPLRTVGKPPMTETRRVNSMILV